MNYVEGTLEENKRTLVLHIVYWKACALFQIIVHAKESVECKQFEDYKVQRAVLLGSSELLFIIFYKPMKVFACPRWSRRSAVLDRTAFKLSMMCSTKLCSK